MKAHELAKLLMEHPEAEVVIESWDPENFDKTDFSSVGVCEIVNDKVVSEINEFKQGDKLPSEVFSISDGDWLGCVTFLGDEEEVEDSTSVESTSTYTEGDYLEYLATAAAYDF